MKQEAGLSRPSRLALHGSVISRAYAGVQALQDVSIEIPRGRVTGLIGPNGAGKSTLVNILTGYDRPDSGHVLIDGMKITDVRPERRARRGVARTFQHGHLFGRSTVLENIEVTALACGAGRRVARQLAVELVAELQLEVWALQSAERLPHGVARRLGVARALAASPNYVLLDEPAAGLNDGESGHLRDTMRGLAKRGVGVLLIDHNMPLIFSSCDYIFVIGAGRNVVEGTPDSVRHDKRLAGSYLGAEAEIS